MSKPRRKYWFALPPPACWATIKPGATDKMSAGRRWGRNMKSRERTVEDEAAEIGRFPWTTISCSRRGAAALEVATSSACANVLINIGATVAKTHGSHPRLERGVMVFL